MGLTISPNDMERLGYYSVNDEQFFHKYEAIERATKVGRPLLFHYNDKFWGAQDWTKEPRETLKTLYKRRAEQLRQKYDYIILCFSGGADSENILRVFEDNNIFIDEIISWHDKSLAQTEDSKMGAEIFKVAIPRTKKYLKKYPQAIHTILDIKKPLIDLYNSINVEEGLTTYLQSRLTIGSPIRGASWVYTESRYKKLIDEGKRVCILWGVDKTLLQRYKGKYVFYFNDEITKRNRKAVNQSSYPVTDEFFYWSEDLPKLVIKQCHMLKKTLANLSETFIDPYTMDIDKEMQITSVYSKTGQRVSIQTINTWLYGWDASTFTVGKPGGNFFSSELDSWVTKYKHEDIVKKWSTAMGVGKEYYRNFWQFYKNPTRAKFTIFMSQAYFIE